MPEVGNPLYVVKSLEESKFIISRIKQRAELDAARRLAASGQLQVHDIKSRVGKLTRIEKRKIKGGDKTLLYERMGLLDEKDLKQYYAKYGIKQDSITGQEQLQEELEGRTKLGRRKIRSRFHNMKEQQDKDLLMKVHENLEKERQEMEEMNEEEL